MKRGGIPGTTPLVAIALMDIAVNNVCRETERDRVLKKMFYSLNFRQHSWTLKNTHTATAYEDNTEGLQHPSTSHHPGQPQEQDDTEDVLEARQVNSHKRPHLWRLEGRKRTKISFN